MSSYTGVINFQSTGPVFGPPSLYMSWRRIASISQSESLSHGHSTTRWHAIDIQHEARSYEFIRLLQVHILWRRPQFQEGECALRCFNLFDGSKRFVLISRWGLCLNSTNIKHKALFLGLCRCHKILCENSVTPILVDKF